MSHSSNGQHILPASGGLTAPALIGINKKVEIIKPKHINWFGGEIGYKTVDVTPEKKMTNSEIRQKSLKALNDAGEGFHNKIASRMPQDHRMEKAILARLMNDNLFLGSCRIGRVKLGRDGNRFSVAEFYVTNFDVNLSTKGKNFYNYGSDEHAISKGAVFFGVGVFTDRYGNRIDFDRNLGDDGIYYQTKDEAVAAYAMASIATGKSFAELKAMDRRNQDKSVSAFAAQMKKMGGNAAPRGPATVAPASAFDATMLDDLQNMNFSDLL